MFIATFDVTKRKPEIAEFSRKEKSPQAIIFNVKKREPVILKVSENLELQTDIN